MKVTVNPEGLISNRLKALLAQRAHKVPIPEVAGEPEVTCQVTIQSKPGEPKKVVLDKASPQMTQDIKPLYVKAHLNGKPVSRILVDNGSAVNVLPLKMIWSFGKSLGGPDVNGGFSCGLYWGNPSLHSDIVFASIAPESADQRSEYLTFTARGGLDERPLFACFSCSL